MQVALRTILMAVWGLLLPLAAAAQNPMLDRAWPKTDFTRFTVDPSRIHTVGHERDTIPSLSRPTMLPQASAELAPVEAVLALDPGEGPARAYPLRYLMRHMVVNDRIGDLAVAVTYCAPSNSAQVFDRRISDEETVSLGVAGLIRLSNALLYDRQTESWWQQATGTALVGARAGTTLRTLPAERTSWAAFRAAHPDGVVMAPPEGWGFDYAANPLPAYDTTLPPRYYQGNPPPNGIPMLARMVRIGTRAWPLARIAASGTLTEAGYTLSWTAGMASPVDAAGVADGRDVGMVRVRDAQGRAVAHDVLFAFAFDAHWPEGEWMLSSCLNRVDGHPC
ncbi:DUF3179 domain-containing (seleno)protein [Pseudooceanicola sp. LIPI14-2-Ac024]|uniref:DUF3179 domain-containing (seleno)protein n=1 Tax=Pseudooceanicola sp. LIPI14-2-Ac024 TaxID=3344875 RepID=UPI0035CEBCBD